MTTSVLVEFMMVWEGKNVSRMRNVPAKRAKTSGRQARVGNIYPVSAARARRHAVGTPLERGVRPQSHRRTFAT